MADSSAGKQRAMIGDAAASAARPAAATEQGATVIDLTHTVIDLTQDSSEEQADGAPQQPAAPAPALAGSKRVLPQSFSTSACLPS